MGFNALLNVFILNKQLNIRVCIPPAYEYFIVLRGHSPLVNREPWSRKMCVRCRMLLICPNSLFPLIYKHINVADDFLTPSCRYDSYSAARGWLQSSHLFKLAKSLFPHLPLITHWSDMTQIQIMIMMVPHLLLTMDL